MRSGLSTPLTPRPAYMDRQVFFEVLVPLMEVKGTATICISTPLGSSNFYSELTRVQDERGRPIFNVLQIGHSMRPEWKPLETYATARAIFGANVALRKRELDGEIFDAEGAVFKKVRPYLSESRALVNARGYHSGDARRVVHETADGAAGLDSPQRHLRGARPERRRQQDQHARLRYGDRLVLHHQWQFCGRKRSVYLGGSGPIGSRTMYARMRETTHS